MAVATGVAFALGTVTTRMENVEKTVAQINKNQQETTELLQAHRVDPTKMGRWTSCNMRGKKDKIDSVS